MKHFSIKEIAISVAYFSLLALVCFGMIRHVVQTYGGNGYFTGHYAKYCYRDGTANTGIKKEIHYQTLAKCGKPLRK